MPNSPLISLISCARVITALFTQDEYSGMFSRLSGWWIFTRKDKPVHFPHSVVASQLIHSFSEVSLCFVFSCLPCSFHPLDFFLSSILFFFLYSLFHISWRGGSSVWLARQNRSVARSILSQHNSVFSLTLIKVHLASRICWAWCGRRERGERENWRGSKEQTDQNAARPQIGLKIKPYSYVLINKSSYWFWKWRAWFNLKDKPLMHLSLIFLLMFGFGRPWTLSHRE